MGQVKTTLGPPDMHSKGLTNLNPNYLQALRCHTSSTGKYLYSGHSVRTAGMSKPVRTQSSVVEGHVFSRRSAFKFIFITHFVLYWINRCIIKFNIRCFSSSAVCCGSFKK